METLVDFDNRTIVGESQYQEFKQNEDGKIWAKDKVSEVLPAGYVLYDENATYAINYNVENSMLVPNSDVVGNKTYEVTSPAKGEAHVAFAVTTYSLEKDEVVIDYGKAIQVDVLANDTDVATDYTKSVVGYVSYGLSTNQKTFFTEFTELNGATFNTTNGAYKVVDNKVQFTPTKMLSSIEKVFAVIKFVKGTDTFYMYNELDIIPATSVYYENDFADFITYTNGGSTWASTAKTGGKDNLQNDGTVGTNEAYGYDTSYADDTKYSNGTAMAISTSTDSKVDGYNKTYATFTFTGTGFDLISTTSQNSGMIRAEIYAGDAIEEGERFIKYAQVANVGASTLYQIPVISYEGLAHGTYTVKLHVYNSYENLTTPELSRGGMFHFDALRVYDPINVEGEFTEGSDAAIAKEAYVVDEEAYNKHFEVREAIISAADFDATAEGAYGDGVVYIDASAIGSVEPNKNPNTEFNSNATVQDYEADGPNNETYLINDSAVIGFILEVDKIPESLQIGAKSVLGNNVMMDMYIVNPATIDEENDYYGDTAYLLTTEDSVFNHASAQNYSMFVNDDDEMVTDFTPYFAKQEDETYQTYVYISKFAPVDENGDVIESDNSILSITDFKATFAEESGMRATYNSGLVNAYNLRNSAEKDEVVTSDVELYSAAFTKASVRYTKQAVLEVETSANVKEIVLVNEKGKAMKADTSVEISENGTSIWTLKFKPGNVGVRTFTVYGRAEDGSETERATVSIEATRR